MYGYKTLSFFLNNSVKVQKNRVMMVIALCRENRCQNVRYANKTDTFSVPSINTTSYGVHDNIKTGKSGILVLSIV